MNFNKKSVKLHGGKDIFILTPKQTNPYITAAEIGKNYNTFANGTGYAYLRDIFLSACTLLENEIIYMPMQFEYKDEHLKSYPDAENHFNSMIFMNYTTSRFKTKDIILVITDDYANAARELV